MKKKKTQTNKEKENTMENGSNNIWKRWYMTK